MTFPTLRAARAATTTRPDPHHYVRLPGGGWCRTMGPPSTTDPITGQSRHVQHLRGNTWSLSVSTR